MADVVDALPASLRIGPYDFRLEAWDGNQSSASRRFGECSTVEQRISVNTSAATAVKVVDTLLHEISHAIFWVYGVEDEDKEERIVGATATGWTQVFRDNPELMRWMQSALGHV